MYFCVLLRFLYILQKPIDSSRNSKLLKFHLLWRSFLYVETYLAKSENVLSRLCWLEVCMRLCTWHLNRSSSSSISRPSPRSINQFSRLC